MFYDHFILLVGNCLFDTYVGYCPVGNCPVGNCPVGYCPSGELSVPQTFRVANMPQYEVLCLYCNINPYSAGTYANRLDPGQPPSKLVSGL